MAKFESMCRKELKFVKSCIEHKGNVFVQEQMYFEVVRFYSQGINQRWFGYIRNILETEIKTSSRKKTEQLS